MRLFSQLGNPGESFTSLLFLSGFNSKKQESVPEIVAVTVAVYPSIVTESRRRFGAPPAPPVDAAVHPEPGLQVSPQPLEEPQTTPLH